MACAVSGFGDSMFRMDAAEFVSGAVIARVPLVAGYSVELNASGRQCSILAMPVARPGGIRFGAFVAGAWLPIGIDESGIDGFPGEIPDPRSRRRRHVWPNVHNAAVSDNQCSRVNDLTGRDMDACAGQCVKTRGNGFVSGRQQFLSGKVARRDTRDQMDPSAQRAGDATVNSDSMLHDTEWTDVFLMRPKRTTERREQ